VGRGFLGLEHVVDLAAPFGVRELAAAVLTALKLASYGGDPVLPDLYQLIVCDGWPLGWELLLELVGIETAVAVERGGDKAVPPL
jgi:hypothetical protein